MKGWVGAFGAFLFIAASGHASAQVIDLSQSGPGATAFKWAGPASSLAGASLVRGDLSGDVNRPDLIVGAPGTGSDVGHAFVVFMGPQHSGTVNLTTADVVLTGAAAGDRFGAATASGPIIRRDVPPLPPRDLAVSAPAAFAGKGAVYVFTGPLARGALNAASAAVVVIGAAGDRLGTAVVASDVDGDGYRDLIMTAPGNNRLYVVFGGPGLSKTYDLGARAANVTIASSASIASLASADLNDDGIKDLAVGVNGGAGAVYVIAGRPRASFTATMTLASGIVLSGTAAGDAAGAALDVADVDADGISDLIVGAPGVNGPGGTRASSGAAYVLLGGSSFMRSRSLAASNTTIYGATVGARLGAAVAHGTTRRQLQDDVLLLAPGASTAGDIDVVYGQPRAFMRSTIDLAAGSDRVVRGDPAGGPIAALVAVSITGTSADIVAGAPQGGSGAGTLYAVYSPMLRLSSSALSATVAQGSTATITVNVKNGGTLDVAWAARSNSPWFTLSPAAGSTSADAPAPLVVTIAPRNLPVGVYHGAFSYVSQSPHLMWADVATVNLTVTAGTPTDPAPTNPFGLPDSPDEGSPNGVATPTGTNVSVVPVADFLVRFTNVTVAGRTSVSISSSTNGAPLGKGVRYGDWVYKVSTTARFTGPVTVAIAYRDFAPQSQNAIRLYGSKDISAWTDLTKHIVWGSNAKLSEAFSVVVPNPAITSFSVTPAKPSAGASITFSATAEGSGGALEYEFWRFDASGGWRIVQPYSEQNEYVWLPAGGDFGPHSAQVWVRRADSSLPYDVWTGASFTVAPPQPVTVVLSSSDTLPAPAGRAITWTATAHGGIGPLQYQFWRYDPERGYSMVQDYGSSNRYTWITTPGDIGNHAVQVWVRSGTSTAAYDAYAAVSFAITTPAPLKATALSVSPAVPAPAGTRLTFTLRTTGGTGPLEYQVWRHDSSSGWRMVQDYGPSPSYVWTTGGGDVGSSAVQIWVRNAGSTAPYDAYATSGFFTVTSPPAATLRSLTSSVPLPTQAGSWMTWNASATSTGGAVEYKFYRYDSGAGWRVVQDYSPASSYTWATAAEDYGLHAVQVWARRAGSTAAYESWLSSGTFTVNGPAKVTIASLTSTLAGAIAPGRTITWTATASGGYGPLQYQFWRYDPSGWHMVRDYAPSNTYQWTPSGTDAGTHAVQVWVRQAGSTAAYEAWKGTPLFTTTPTP